MEFDDIAVQMWLSHKYSLQAIASLYGCSRNNILYHLRKRGIDTSKSMAHIEVSCFECKTKFKIVRCRERKSTRHFCSETCYFKFLHNPDYQDDRNQGRIARKIIASVFPELNSAHIVHHEDKNRKNNRITNLIVFKNQSDHLTWHRAVDHDIIPLFDGRKATPEEIKITNSARLMIKTKPSTIFSMNFKNHFQEWNQKRLKNKN